MTAVKRIRNTTKAYLGNIFVTKFYIAKRLIPYSVLLLFTGVGANIAYAGSEGNIGFCVYMPTTPSMPVHFDIKQAPGSTCFYPQGKCQGAQCTYPKADGEVFENIIVVNSGLTCTKKVWHYELNSSVLSTCGMLDTANSNISISSPDIADSITFNFTNGSQPHTVALYKVGQHTVEQTIPTTMLALSVDQSLSGVSELDCPGGWCVNGQSPGSTAWIIYSPSNDMNLLKLSLTNTAPGYDHFHLMGTKQRKQDCLNSQSGKKC